MIGACRSIDITGFGAVPFDISANLTNVGAINSALAAASPGDTVFVPRGFTFFLVGGVHCDNLENVTVAIEGVLSAVFDLENWPMGTGTSSGGGHLVYVFTPSSFHPMNCVRTHELSLC